MSLPTRTKIVTNTRDLLIFDTALKTDPPQSNRCAIFWDADKDERIQDVAVALHYRDPRVHAHLLALSETHGVVTAWVSTNQYLDKMRAVIQEAANVALRPYDRWEIAPLEAVAMSHGIVNRHALPEGSLLRTIPARYELGLVRV